MPDGNHAPADAGKKRSQQTPGDSGTKPATPARGIAVSLFPTGEAVNRASVELSMARATVHAAAVELETIEAAGLWGTMLYGALAQIEKAKALIDEDTPALLEMSGLQVVKEERHG